MTLIRWHRPSLAVSHAPSLAHDGVERLFDRLFEPSRFAADTAAVFHPAVDIEETPDAYVIHADLPGLTEKDVKVGLVGDLLTLRGERKSQREVKEGSWHHDERVHGAFERAFRLPKPVQSDRVTASTRHGVLEIRVPKAEQARAREIEVQAG
ncbi:MAG: Hsp20/alpha crystallin family protein [Candidatus Eisenbacteria bacterium]|uniref:Hsp20/alpha crystallin family protein n=1 Tax=Eiseniibacteriota bacterium TaxID=2212470 RepID=A0A849SK12_UNCEI|nr:Hsp20/alpha crystallin family protein [Candidatus Eisenbacteria bacterium]